MFCVPVIGQKLMAKAVNFIDQQGEKVSILASDLEKYPESLLSMIVSKKDKKLFDVDANAYKLDFLEDTLKHVAQFYATGQWPNPFVPGNQLRLDSVGGDFFRICDYLNLPYIFDEIEEEEFDDWDEQDYLDRNAYDEYLNSLCAEDADDEYESGKYDDWIDDKRCKVSFEPDDYDY